MNTRGFLTRAAVGVAGGALLIGVAGVAIAAEVDDQEVQIDVTIDAVGALTMTVDSASMTLNEVDEPSDPETREFTGTLPTVTVTDDREVVPAGTYWYVVGQASAFTGPEELGPEYLGWTPRLLTDTPEVSEGDPVVTVLDEPTNQPNTAPNNVGLVGEEFLALALDAQAAQPVGSIEATADVFLKTPLDVTPGSYTGKITLTLWDEAY